MKVVHVILKCGQERLASLQTFSNLQSWWMNYKGAGHIIGEYWACPFDEVAFAEVVEANVQGVEEQTSDDLVKMSSIARSTGSLAEAIASGRWKPPSE